MRVRSYGVVALAAIAGMAVSVDAFAKPEPRGRIHLDYAFHDEDNVEMADGHRLRRARLGVSGSIDDDWSYQSEIDFAENGVGFRDAYLRYNGLDNGAITIGNFKVPFGMDELTSSNHLAFIERSLPTSFAQSRRVGVGYSTGGDNFGFSTMLFGQGVGTNNDRVAEGADEGFGFGARFYGTPIRTGDNVLHLGAALTTEDTASSEDETARFRARPESRVTGIRLVDTGTIENVDRINRFGLEAGYQAGPLTLQGEYLSVNADRQSGFSSYDFDGYYAQASYVFGSQRNYRGGAFRNPEPGSWEMALRFSSINLDDADILGGEEDNVTLGLNYYAAPNVRFMWNYISVDSERAGVSEDPNIFLFRTQVSF
ncbi:phosphate-selective porin OprO/OprP [Natronospira proteinivora]|uniref:Phosphate-selective porin OprO/OprP n=1 Tax=Natronospira proteinivora TaxID=1807133 RepID=A0ABT1G5G5_9GAMM|nr:OprO/OprP family phosphate-selective porin [Natronospira proteinivora]MCP1726539.1 phosphate-selective porin OprO/OprP [Natronospira proteinivora]